jgi:hypothetical protein
VGGRKVGLESVNRDVKTLLLQFAHLQTYVEKSETEINCQWVFSNKKKPNNRGR